MPESRGCIQGPRDEHRIVFYGLSTCIWCRRTRQYPPCPPVYGGGRGGGLGVTFEYAYVDLLHGQEQEEVLAQVRRWNPSVSFPTIVVDDVQCVVGYRPEELQEVLGL